VLDLDTDGPASRADEPPPDRSIGTAVMVVLALVAVVIVLSLVAGGSDDGDPAAASTTTTTTRPSPSRPGPPSRPRVPGSADEPGPVLAEDVRLDPVLGMAIVSVRGPGATVTVADLATGAELVLGEGLPTGASQGIWWTGSTLVSRSNNGSVYRLEAGPPGAWVRLDTTEFDPVWPGVDDLVHLWGTESSQPGSHYGVLEPDGTIARHVLPPGAQEPPVGVVDGSLVVNTGDGIYLLDPSGQARRHALGTALGVSHGRLVRRTCDEVLVCRLFLDDLVNGTSVDVGTVDAGRAVRRALPAPDGSAVALVLAADGELRLAVHPLPSGPELSWRIGSLWSDPYMLQWAPDSSGLAWIEGERWSVGAVVLDGDERPEPASVRLAQPVGSGGVVATFLVPRTSLPEDWRPVN